MKKNIISNIFIILIIIAAIIIYRKYDFNFYSKGIIEGGKTSFSRDSSEKINNKRSYKIVNNDYNDAMFFKKIEVKKYTPYKISCMIKTSDVEQYEGAQIAGAQIILKNTEEHSEILSGTNDWTQMEFCFNSKNNEEVEVGFRLGGNGYKAKGTAWFADLKIEESVSDFDNNWNFACFVFDEVNVKLENNVTIKEKINSLNLYNIQNDMEKFTNTCATLSGHKMFAKYDFYEIKEPITTLTYDEENGYYISEKDVYNLINNYVRTKEYDHIFLCAKLPREQQLNKDITVDWIGLGNMEYCGKGLSNIRVVDRENASFFSEEVFLHEFLHTLERNAEEYGYERPALHDYSKYGYTENGMDGLKVWYKDYMNQIINSNGGYIGLPAEIYKYKPVQLSNFKYSIQLNVLDEPRNIIETIKSILYHITSLFEKTDEAKQIVSLSE